MASTNTSDLPEKPDSAGSASTQTQPPQHIAVQEPTFPVSKRAKEEERGGWKGLGRFWERRREDGSKKYVFLGLMTGARGFLVGLQC